MKRATLIALILFVYLISPVVFSLVDTPHSFNDRECVLCHVGDPRKGKENIPLVAPEEELCADCHSDLEETLSHPVGVYPRNTVIPPDMPLSDDGTLTCSTCHDIHMPYKNRFGLSTHFLRRMVQGRQFCAICHLQQGITDMIASAGRGHEETMQTAHLKPRFFALSNAGPIDSVSAQCLSCHDGSMGKAAPVKAGLWQHGDPLMGFNQQAYTGVHPVGIDYEESSMEHPDLKPSAMIPRKIKLVNGKVSCISCHDPYSNNRAQLISTNRNGELCLGCHDK
ncbi:MAG: hypothetical protein D6710_01565 [Nitrospirae bacterium]|nr:MAG: hypothetical protein D6710_01565 [Nitrospirota bacterium]